MKNQQLIKISVWNVTRLGFSRLTSPESYFVSEALYCVPEDLENTRKITLEVSTLGCHLESPDKKDDFEGLSKTLRKYVPREGDNFILDIDLDFFSTRNPFRGLYENADLYSHLRQLYYFQRPEDESDPKSIQKAVQKRQTQLSELEGIFKHLQEHRNLQDYPNISSERSQAISAIVREIEENYPGEEVDWELVHDAGCTCDDTELPHHVTSRDDIQTFINTSFAGLLSSLPGPPTIITISRSSEDDYCPPEDVEYIQEAVLKVLRKVYSPVKLTLAYEEEQDD